MATEGNTINIQEYYTHLYNNIIEQYKKLPRHGIEPSTSDTITKIISGELKPGHGIINEDSNAVLIRIELEKQFNKYVKNTLYKISQHPNINEADLNRNEIKMFIDKCHNKFITTYLDYGNVRFYHPIGIIHDSDIICTDKHSLIDGIQIYGFENNDCIFKVHLNTDTGDKQYFVPLTHLFKIITSKTLIVHLN